MKTIYKNTPQNLIRIKKDVLKKRKKKLINNPTKSQKRAERIVRKIAFQKFGYKVQSERILKPYIIDIYIKSIKIGIEIDGGIHKSESGYDNKRDEFLMVNHGVSIIRFKNEDVGTEYFKKSIWAICCDGKYRELVKLKEKAINSKMERIFSKTFPFI